MTKNIKKVTIEFEESYGCNMCACNIFAEQETEEFMFSPVRCSKGHWEGVREQDDNDEEYTRCDNVDFELSKEHFQEVALGLNFEAVPHKISIDDRVFIGKNK